jgi:hypothetical protein
MGPHEDDVLDVLDVRGEDLERVEECPARLDGDGIRRVARHPRVLPSTR